jgi:hypothetical protein
MSEVVAPSVADDFEVSTNFLSDAELKDQLAAEQDSHTAGAGQPAADEGADARVEVERRASASGADTSKPDRRSREGKAKSIQAEIDRDVARREAAKREADAEEARLQALREQQTAPAATTEEDDPEPTADQFADAANPWEAHQRALARWDARQEFKAQEAKRQQALAAAEQTRAAETSLSTFETTLKAEVGDIPTFLGKVGHLTNQLVPFARLPQGEAPTGYTAIADSIVVSSIPGKLLLHFDAHREDFDRIGKLPPNVALREVGILEGRLGVAVASHGPTSPRFVGSAAPPPTKPLGGSPSVRDESDDDDDLSEAAVNRRIEARRPKLRR